MKKVYEVFVTDINNNNYLIGFFKNLDDCIEGVNCYVTDDKLFLQKGDIKEYAGFFEPCFDTRLSDVWESRGLDLDEIDDDEDIMVRGFIIEYNDSLDELIR